MKINSKNNFCISIRVRHCPISSGDSSQPSYRCLARPWWHIFWARNWQLRSNSEHEIIEMSLRMHSGPVRGIRRSKEFTQCSFCSGKKTQSSLISCNENRYFPKCPPVLAHCGVWPGPAWGQTVWSPWWPPAWEPSRCPPHSCPLSRLLHTSDLLLHGNMSTKEEGFTILKFSPFDLFLKEQFWDKVTFI